MKLKSATLLLILLSATTSIASCASTPTTTVLQVPSRPALPVITGEELQCLSVEAYLKLVIRDKLLHSHVETLEQVIRSTN